MQELAAAKAEAENFTRLQLEKRAREDEIDIIEFLKKNESEQSNYFKVTEEHAKELDEDYLKMAMKHLFDEREKLSLLFSKGRKRLICRDNSTFSYSTGR